MLFVHEFSAFDNQAQVFARLCRPRLPIHSPFAGAQFGGKRHLPIDFGASFLYKEDNTLHRLGITMPEDAQQPGQKQNNLDVNTMGGDAVGRDKVIIGDDVHGDKVMGDKYEGNIFQRITNFFAADTEQQQAFRNRENMLKLVWNTWIEGGLKKSLCNGRLIELGMETRPDAVVHPWNMVMQIPDREPKMVAPGTTMLELFDQANRSLLILGEPGSGKTTMLLELARQTIERAQVDPTQPIPAVFNLSSWTDINQPLALWIVEELASKYHIPRKYGRSWLANNSLLPLLDGLDEVQKEHQAECVKSINQFSEECGLSGLVVCSRLQDYCNLPERLHLNSALQLLILTPEQIYEYLESAGEQLEVLHRTLQEDESLREMACSPLVLRVLYLAQREFHPKIFLGQGEETINRRRYHLLNIFVDYIMLNRKGLHLKKFADEKARNWLSLFDLN